ncbi:MAG: hypothetical protein AB1673_03050 [Actinomycetota bacterium]
MAKVTQIAFQIDNESLAAVDREAERRSVARAEVLRLAVRRFLAAEREADIDARLAAGYDARPAGANEEALAEVSLDGLAAADLDW